MMHTAIRQLAAAAALALATLGPSVALAVKAPSVTQAHVACTDSIRTDDTTLNPSYVSCTGSFSDNMPEDSVTLGGIEYDFIGKTGNDNTGSGPFGAFGADFNTGILTFDESWMGDFVLGIKAGNRHSFYHFVSATGVSSIAFDTLGVDVNVRGIGKGVSHVNLYGGEPVPDIPAIPEPGTLALMLAGLGAIGFMARRRGGAKH